MVPRRHHDIIVTGIPGIIPQKDAINQAIQILHRNDATFQDTQEGVIVYHQRTIGLLAMSGIGIAEILS